MVAAPWVRRLGPGMAMIGLARLSGGNFLVVGRAGMDLYADPPNTRIEEATRFSAALGGSSANIAVALVRLGLRATLVSSVSDDAVGRFCLKQLDTYGVDTRHIRTVAGEARTSLAVVESRAENCQSVIYRNGAADFLMTPQDVELLDYVHFSGLIVTGTALATEPSRSAAYRAFEHARAAGLPVVFDVDYRPYSWQSPAEAAEVCSRAAAMSDVVVGNDMEFGVMAGDHALGLDHARSLVASAARIVIYKMGENGAITFTPTEEFTTGVYESVMLKPTGAGDSFLGAFVGSLSAGMSVREAVLHGSAAAAMVVARIGCAPAMPTRSELEAFMATRVCAGTT
jgi:5-dehydro-2-deoxygluconokinase